MVHRADMRDEEALVLPPQSIAQQQRQEGVTIRDSLLGLQLLLLVVLVIISSSVRRESRYGIACLACNYYY